MVALLYLLLLQVLLFGHYLVAAHSDCGTADATEKELVAARSADRSLFGKLISYVHMALVIFRVAVWVVKNQSCILDDVQAIVHVQKCKEVSFSYSLPAICSPQ
jgi:hypothetical protein